MRYTIMAPKPKNKPVAEAPGPVDPVAMAPEPRMTITPRIAVAPAVVVRDEDENPEA